MCFNRQRRVLNYKTSQWGPVLGPLLLLVHIYDLTVNLKCDVKLFADHAPLFTIAYDPNKAAAYINHDLDIITHRWVCFSILAL